MPSQYIGRFAPSPTGPLHAGSLVAALASWLDARAHNGKWLIRIEDVDTTRAIKGVGEVILNQLASLGLTSDAPVVYQSKRSAQYTVALEKLKAQDLVYPCTCSRKDVLMANGSFIYPRTCRTKTAIKDESSPQPLKVAWRFKTDDQNISWLDRRLWTQSQNVEAEVGDFVIKRADGLFAYQLAVVVDDAEQRVTHIVRGEDLADNTARQIALQKALNLIGNSYLHVPLVLAEDGEKLSKQNGAEALDLAEPLKTLNLAAVHLGLTEQYGKQSEALMTWTTEWAHLYNHWL